MSDVHIRSFVVLAEEGAFVRAAPRLHVTQPPLTRRIQALEAELGATLFERRARGVKLTEAGRAFLPHARRILAAHEAAKLAVKQDRPSDEAPLTGDVPPAD
ncbi:MAG: LysR family transcriptional regulator [Myxococcota bacterium]